MAINASHELGGDTAFFSGGEVFFACGIYKQNLLQYGLNLSFIPLKYRVRGKLAF